MRALSEADASLLPCAAWARAVRAQLTALELNTRSAWNDAAHAWGALFLASTGLPGDQKVYQRLYRDARIKRDDWGKPK